MYVLKKINKMWDLKKHLKQIHSNPSVRENQNRSKTKTKTCLSKKLANKQLDNVGKVIRSLTELSMIQNYFEVHDESFVTKMVDFVNFLAYLVSDSDELEKTTSTPRVMKHVKSVF